MKLHKYIIGLALLVSSSSCNFLDEEAYEFITPDNFYKTEADANAALTAVYNTFADEKSYRRYIWMGADFPGEAANANASAPSRVEMDNLTWTPTTDFCKNIWTKFLKIWRKCHDFLSVFLIAKTYIFLYFLLAFYNNLLYTAPSTVMQSNFMSVKCLPDGELPEDEKRNLAVRGLLLAATEDKYESINYLLL